MPETINASEIPIVGIFANNYRFEIPDYQRPYAWTTNEAGELLDDLLYSAERVNDVESVGKASPYFMGSIVIIKDGDDPLAQVVDGQQRITTLTILFCVLRDLAPIEDRDEFQMFIQEIGNKLAGVPGRFRLTVRERDRKFFQNNIQEKNSLAELVKQTPVDLPDSQQRMFENAKHLWKSVSDLSSDQRTVLATFIVQRCYLVVVATSDQESAYRIFAVMNDRGLDLSPTDIIKARIIGGMPNDIRPKYTDTWEGIEEEVGRDEFRDIFSHVRMIHLKAKLRGTLQQEFQDGVLNQTGETEFIDHVLVPYADAYEALTRKPHESYGITTESDKTNELLRHLNRLDNFDWIPSAMAFFKNNPQDFNEQMRFIRDLERLAYGLFLMRANINWRINRYAQVIRAIESGDDLFADSSPLQLKQEEKMAIFDALNGQIYDQNRVSRIGKPLLLRLDSVLADAGAAYNHPIISIEHVLPQRPAEDSDWGNIFSEEERSMWTGKLANLVLLSYRKNYRAQNFDFERKKKVYFNQGEVVTFALTMQVLNESEWTPAVLERRQRDLIDRLKKEWRLG